jgi:hypothetical protein
VSLHVIAIEKNNHKKIEEENFSILSAVNKPEYISSYPKCFLPLFSKDTLLGFFLAKKS